MTTQEQEKNTWFTTALKREMLRRGLRTQAELAEVLGKPSASVSRWIRGKQSPAFDDLSDIAGRLGWRMGDADPLPKTTRVKRQKPPATVIGHVSAEDGANADFARDDGRTFESPDKVWEKSPYRHLVANSPIVYFDVQGESMEPDFPHGSFLACARPATDDLPELTPVIARARDQMTFKLYRATRTALGHPEVELVPVNQCIRTLRFEPHDVVVEYVVLGVVKPWSHVIGLQLQPAAARVRA